MLAMYRQTPCALLGNNGRYNAVLHVHLNPIMVAEIETPVSYKILDHQLAPGQKIPDGNYLRQPHVYEPKGSIETRVHVKDGRMYEGWQ